MLHLTNGDVAAAKLRQTGLTGQVVPWRDVLHEGPVPAGLPLERMSETRARFVASQGWTALQEALRQFADRDAALRVARRVTLWFEHDLYDQLQLLQILATLAEQPETSAELIVIDRFPGVEPFHGLGQLTPTQLALLWPRRRPVKPAQLAVATRAWKAFTSPNPAALRELLAADLDSLPLLRPALLRLLEEYPTAPGGVSRTDRQILQVVAAGAERFDAIFPATQALELAPFHGDTTLRAHLSALISAPSPLVTPEPHRLTDAGRRVLAGELDNRQLNGLDRWIGGVHLKSVVRPG